MITSTLLYSITKINYADRSEESNIRSICYFKSILIAGEKGEIAGRQTGKFCFVPYSVAGDMKLDVPELLWSMYISPSNQPVSFTFGAFSIDFCKKCLKFFRNVLESPRNVSGSFVDVH